MKYPLFGDEGAKEFDNIDLLIENGRVIDGRGGDPFAADVVVVGDRQPYLSALITLDVENLDKLRELSGASGGTIPELANDPKVQDYLQSEIESECNSKVARYQTIKKIKVLPVEFSVEGDELTPTMKIKRNVVSKKYAAEIDALYA